MSSFSSSNDSPNAVHFGDRATPPVVSFPTRAKSALQSRINMLQKTLVFKTTAHGEKRPQSRRYSPQTAILGGGRAALKITTSLTNRKDGAFETLQVDLNDRHQRTTTVLGPVSTPFGRNVRKEIQQHKFDGLAKLFAKKKNPFRNLPVRENTLKSSAVEDETQSNESLILPKRKYATATIPNRQMLLQPDSDEDRDNANEKSEPSEVASTLGCSVVEDISQLICNWRQENVILRKVSFVLREFYKSTAPGTKKSGNLPNNLAQYDMEVAYANKCLMVSALKQSIIEEEIKLIQQPSLNNRTVQSGKPDANVGQGCLALRKITLPLRAQSSSTFVFCVVRHQGQVIDSVLLNTSISRNDGQPTLQFNIDQLFENLAANFQVVVQFYLMNLPSGIHVSDHYATKHKAIFGQLKEMMKHNKFTDFIKLMIAGKKKNRMNGDTDMLAPNGIFKILNVGHVNTDHVPVAGSAFKPFGSITINRANGTATRFPIDQFDYTTSPSQDHAVLDLELSINYGTREETNESFGVHIESRSLDTGPFAQKQLNFAKFKFSKCSVVVDGKWLKIRTKRSSHMLDLGRCLNSAHFDQATIRSLPQSICLLFKETIDHPDDPYPELNLGDQSSQHQFVFLTSHKPELMAHIFGRMMARVAAVHQWQEPVPSKDDSISFVVAPPVKQQDIVGQRKLTNYSALLANVTVL